MRNRIAVLAAILSLPMAISAQVLNTTPPSATVKLIFIHHSTGEAWLADGHGQLGLTLRDNNYFVSDTNYVWGPGGIGNSTDIGNWWDWFSGPDRSTYCSALYTEYVQHCTYSRKAADPGGENLVIMFKSCFPNSNLGGSPSDPVPAIGSNPLRGQSAYSQYHTVGNAKGIYIELLNYFALHQDKMFVAVTAPPLRSSDTNATNAANARAFNDWLVNEWLASYPYHNVFVFDFYNVLTSDGGSTRVNDPNTNDLEWADGNHHRIRSDSVQHLQTLAHNYLAYWTGDSHPSAAGDRKASGELAALLNAAYHCWQGNGACPSCSVTCTASAPVNAVAGSAVTFSGSASAANCSASPTYDWNFGDGTAHSAEPSPSHTYSTPGTYSWTLTAGAGSGACTRAGSVRASSVVPLAVPSGSIPLVISSGDGGTTGTVTWDAGSCPSAGYHLVYGYGSSLASWSVAGGACNLGTTGTYSWTNIPTPTTGQRFLWFLMVGDDKSSTEGSWGKTSAGTERGSGASNVCSMTTRNLSGVCGWP